MAGDPSSITAALAAHRQQELDPGEHVVWQGQPLQGVRLGLTDLLVSGVTLAWLWHVLNWPSGEFTREGLQGLSLLHVPFLLVGAYVCVGRIFFDAALRRSTLYCLTQRRALVIAHFPSRRVLRVDLAVVPEIQCVQGLQGCGDIVFGARLSARRGLPRSPRFNAVPEVDSVYALVQRAVHQARYGA